jgi:hypothetical protein
LDVLRARLVTATGWTWEHIDATMTLPRYRQLARYWQGTPPLPEAVAGVLRGFGVELEMPPEADPATGEPPMRMYSPEEVARIFGAAGFST